jgi:hypothetical protein
VTAFYEASLRGSVLDLMLEKPVFFLAKLGSSAMKALGRSCGSEKSHLGAILIKSPGYTVTSTLSACPQTEGVIASCLGFKDKLWLSVNGRYTEYSK